MLQEERLAAELEKRKLDSIRDEKMRQQIRETRYRKFVRWNNLLQRWALGTYFCSVGLCTTTANIVERKRICMNLNVYPGIVKCKTLINTNFVLYIALCMLGSLFKMSISRSGRKLVYKPVHAFIISSTLN